jgi:FkbM family methyltransferase
MTAAMNGQEFREAFLRSVLLEFSQPPRTFNDDALRGFKASNNLGPHELMFVEDHSERIANLYNALSDQQSKQTLAFFYLNRALGGLHSHGPHITADFLALTESIVNYTSGKGRRLFQHQWLHRPIFIEEYDMSIADQRIKLDTHDISALEIFLLEEYTYRGATTIEAKPGDTIIDAGACWGDTALYLAAKSLPDGHVYAFELSEGNIGVLNANLAKNPDLAPHITVVQRPLSGKSGDDMWFIDAGAASRIASQDNGGTKLQSLSIDDFVKQEGIKRVDFMKFDIEGAERHALDGAEETIRTHKPTLAISVYHLPDDPFVIAEKIFAMSNDYRFSMKGVCKNYGETILFCQSASRMT